MSRPKDLNSPSPWNMRIWDNKLNKWLCVNEPDELPYYGFDIRGGEVTAFQGVDWIYKQHQRWNDFIWERSTGLRDKNGVEIYEGDILENEKFNFRSAIKWDAKQAKFIYEKNPAMIFYEEQVGHYMTVIGNIHENLELLGGENNGE